VIRLGLEWLRRCRYGIMDSYLGFGDRDFQFGKIFVIIFFWGLARRGRFKSQIWLLSPKERRLIQRLETFIGLTKIAYSLILSIFLTFQSDRIHIYYLQSKLHTHYIPFDAIVLKLLKTLCTQNHHRDYKMMMFESLRQRMSRNDFIA